MTLLLTGASSARRSRCSASRPRAGLRVDRAEALLRSRPLGIDEALARFRAEREARGAVLR